mgnify:CR=1 FL=1
MRRYRQRMWVRLAGLLPLVLLCPLAQGGVTLSSDTVKGKDQVVDLWVDLDRDNVIKFDKLDQDGNFVPSDDRTSLERPFRFWINNDYDAVLYKDQSPKLDRKTCGDLKTEDPILGPPHQVCEQDDYLKGGSNIDPANLTGIESLRDLEDFIPLALRIAPWSGKVEGIKFKVRAVGIRVNLFKGEWTRGSEYLTDSDVAKKQVKADHLVTLDANWWEVPRALIEVQPTDDKTGPTGLVRLLLEGLSGTAACNDRPEDCYLEVMMEDASGTETVSSKTYLQLYDIKKFYDHYTVGQGTDTSVPPSASAEPALQTASRSLLPDQRSAATAGEYILFVHGWRMQAAERVSFAETALKRLYWSGYRGRFGLFSWPTGWFPKPTWQGTAKQAIRAAGAPQNYNNSEAIARRSAAGLAQLLDTGGALGGYDVFVFAHSMGNVVVSEALRQPTGKSPLVLTYIATQAAETASAYDPTVEERNESNSSWPYEENSLFNVTDWFFANPGSCRYRYYAFTALDPDQSKNLLANAITTYSVNPGDEPAPAGDAAYVRCEVPDKYRYFAGTQHLRDEGATTPAPPAHYYAGIGARAGRILNFYNTKDFALEGWEFNAMTKPDSGLAFWGFNAATEWIYEGDVLLDAVTPANRWQVADHYLFDPSIHPDNTEFGWDATAPNPGQYEAMAHIIPPRTRALGAVATAGGEVVKDRSVDLGAGKIGFTARAYDHSAEFLSDYIARNSYWNALLDGFRLRPGI